MSMKELKKREELAEIKRERRDYRGLRWLGVILMGVVFGFVLADHWNGLRIGLMVLGGIGVVYGLIGEHHYDTKCKEYIQHMEGDIEEDKT